MKGKKWVFGFLLLTAVLTIGYMAVGFYANTKGYYTKQHHLPYYYRVDYTRAIKAQYLLDHKDEYDAVILGGSKSGCIDTDLMSEGSGLRYYNMYVNLGNYKDYLDYTRFLVEEVGIKEITLVLSSYEVTEYDRADKGDCYETPAILKGNLIDRVAEFLRWMLVDVNTLKKTLRSRGNKDEAIADMLIDGRRNLIREIYQYNQDPEAFTEKALENFQERLGGLFAGVKSDPEVLSQCLDALREMKQICDSRQVKLNVVIGASMITERWRYESEDYYDYISRLVRIAGQVWDFSSFNDVNMNRYNLLDPNHYDAEVADLMVNTIYGKEQHEGFGILLTEDNVFDYLAQRRADFVKLKEEYEQTGTIRLGTMDDPGYLPWRTQWVSSKAGEELFGDKWTAFMQNRDEAFADPNDEELS